LIAAAQNGQTETVSYLLEQGADPSITTAAGATPLREAVQNGHVDVVDALLQAGADPDLDTDHTGRSPLVWAVLKADRQPRDEAIRMLETLTRGGAKCRQTFTHPVNDSTVRVAEVAEKVGADYAAAYRKACAQ